MSSHFLTLYESQAQLLVNAVGSKDADLGVEIAEQLSLNSDEQNALSIVLSRTYTRDAETWEHPDGHHIVRAFASMCGYFAVHTDVIELYDDEERAPYLWELCWSDWDGEDPFQLPLSPFGCPSVTFHGHDRLTRICSGLKGIQKKGNTYADFISDDELDALIGVIAHATKSRSGLFTKIEY
ncbi:MAG: hypothetical protein KDA69_06435 [Planctomycetaceae bacterium]|nr:hypothetical protein [Planctomycetaceae bacterium]MCB9954241.1 hypothetical protein [Planctomycetaceae bacterium]